MQVQILRPMRASEDGLPIVGHGAVKLGVRPSDAVTGDDGNVLPRDGLSVATTYEGILRLPSFLRPFKECTIPLTSSGTDGFALSLYNFRNSSYEPFKIDHPVSEKLSLRGKSRSGCGYVTVADGTKAEASDFDAMVQQTRSKWSSIDWADAAREINSTLDEY